MPSTCDDWTVDGSRNDLARLARERGTRWYNERGVQNRRERVWRWRGEIHREADKESNEVVGEILQGRRESLEAWMCDDRIGWVPLSPRRVVPAWVAARSRLHFPVPGQVALLIRRALVNEGLANCAFSEQIDLAVGFIWLSHGRSSLFCCCCAENRRHSTIRMRRADTVPEIIIYRPTATRCTVHTHDDRQRQTAPMNTSCVNTIMFARLSRRTSSEAEETELQSPGNDQDLSRKRQSALLRVSTAAKRQTADPHLHQIRLKLPPLLVIIDLLCHQQMR